MNVRLSVLLLTIVLCAIPAAGADEPLATLDLPLQTHVFEGDASQSVRLVEIGLRVAMPTTVHLIVTAEPREARLGHDYLDVAEEVTFLPGETRKQVPIWIIGDTIDENDEGLLLRVAQNGVHRGSMWVTIIDDDQYPWLAPTDDTVVTERARTTFAVFRFKLHGSPKTFAVAQYSTEDGTAIAGQDYVAASGWIVFAPGENSFEVRVEIIDDNAFEGDETFSIRLKEPHSLYLSNPVATATIVSDDPITPPLTLSSHTELEGDSGSRDIQFTVALTSAASFPVTVSVEPTGAGSARAGSDYAMLPQSLTFAPGVTEQAAYATIFGDLENESNEEFEVAVVEDGAVRTTTLVKIVDDDSRVKPAVSVADVQLGEGDGPSQAVFVVTLSKAATEPVRVSFRTVGDTASAPGDYEHVTGEVVFVPGETSRSVTVKVAGDDLHEKTETFRLELSNPAGLTIADGSALCTIADDDPPKRRAARH